MKSYKGIYIPRCPNECFERFVDEVIEKNTIEGVAPKLRGHSYGSSSVDALRYSKKLKRHGRTANGNYVSWAWSHCPYCGAGFLECRQKVKSLNSIEVVDFSCSNGECEYVLGAITAQNIKTLLDGGFTAAQIDEATGDDKDFIDLSTLAFQFSNATWWNLESGFREEEQ